ncbi:MAG: hypothetical protein KGL67_02130 [Patescibacteria group bacterium]|nr:hypothetical protein [Patescibacteria group bacterium]
MASPAHAVALPNWDVTGTYTWLVLGTYSHDMVLTMNPDGTFTGTGGYPSGDSPYALAGQTAELITNGIVSGNTISFTLTYTGPYAVGSTWNITGTIASDGTISGTFPWEWHTTSGLAKSITYVNHIGPISSGSPDGSSCGPEWANDTYNLFFTVTANGDGTYLVRTAYKDGTFITIDGESPGKCSQSNHHGTSITGGIKGKFQGFVSETVTATSFDPSVCTTSSDACKSRSSFIHSVFGAPITENNSSWNFEYNSSNKTLTYRHWQDKSNSDGTNDVFEGDIAN